MKSMDLLRLSSILALAAWIGGLVALGAVVAPELFAALEAADPAAGRELAGRVFGSAFHQFQYLAWAAGVVVLATLGLRAALGPRPRRLAVRFWTTSAMLAASVLATFVIAPAIEAVRLSTAGPVASLAASDPARILFGRLHGASTGLMLFTIVAGIGLIWAELQDRH